jgi:hypothetical protein
MRVLVKLKCEKLKDEDETNTVNLNLEIENLYNEGHSEMKQLFDEESDMEFASFYFNWFSA